MYIFPTNNKQKRQRCLMRWNIKTPLPLFLFSFRCQNKNTDNSPRKTDRKSTPDDDRKTPLPSRNYHTPFFLICQYISNEKTYFEIKTLTYNLKHKNTNRAHHIIQIWYALVYYLKKESASTIVFSNAWCPYISTGDNNTIFFRQSKFLWGNLLCCIQN